jgi:pimeloyl-ACP methyl ester carboxylesterase
MPYIKANGINIYYEVNGKGKEWIVFIMGLGMPGFAWEEQIKHFSKEWKVLTFDNRGIGKTDKPPGPYSIKDMAKDTIELTKALGIESAHFVGISMGGMIVQEIGINYPSCVKTLTMASTYAKADERIREHVKSASEKLGIMNLINDIPALFSVAEKINQKETMEKIVHFLLPLTLSKEFIEKRKKDILKLVERIMETPPTINSFFGQVVATQTHDALDRLHLINSPTLVITGTADHLVPHDCSDEIAKRIKGAKLVKIKGGSHGINFENADEFNREVEKFIKEATHG